MLFILQALVGGVIFTMVAVVTSHNVAAQVTPKAPERNFAHIEPMKFRQRLPPVSGDCHTVKIAGDSYLQPLRSMRKAVRDGREVRVLAIGSSSTAGVGASQPQNTYLAKLEDSLGSVFDGCHVSVIGRGKSGENAEGQSSRMEAVLAEVKPDLIVWQVGTNDAIRRVDLTTFKDHVRRTLVRLRKRGVDIVLVDPQYGNELNRDSHYPATVAALAEVAREMRVLLVDRFEAMRELSGLRGDAFYLTSDKVHLNDNGHRCMAEQLSHAIVAGVLVAENEAASAGRP